MRIYITIDKVLYLEAFTGPYMWSVTQGFLLSRKKPMPRKDWALDSGGFGELRKNGKYSFTTEQYITAVNRLNPNIFFAMDWMCEPIIIKKTGLSVKEHQKRTTENILAIKNLNEKGENKNYAERLGPIREKNPLGDFSLRTYPPEISSHSTYSELAGVIQGWTLYDYIEHIDQLRDHDCITPIMGIGSVCRRNSEEQIIEILRAIKQELPKIKLHGFGIKTSIIKKYPETTRLLDSIDSAAWGWMPGCWNAHGRAKIPYVAKFAKRLEMLNSEAMRDTGSKIPEVVK